MDAERFFANVKALPINVDFDPPRADTDAGRIYTATGVFDRPGDETPSSRRTMEFRWVRQASFVYNERFALEGVIDFDIASSPNCRRLILRFLPTGCLIAIFLHPVECAAHHYDARELQTLGADFYNADLQHSGFIHDIVESLASSRVIRHCPSLPYDLLIDPARRDRGPTRAEFCDEMAWRAWATGNFVTLASMAAAPDWAPEAAYRELPVLDAPNGCVRSLFNNYFGWRLACPASGHDGRATHVITEALEPIMYMISRRSLCASGLRNIRDLSRAFVWGDDPLLSVAEMRRYVSAARLAILAPREYDESSDKLSRAIYRRACDDLDIEARVSEFNDYLDSLVDEVRGLQAERDEYEARKLNRIAFGLTCVFGLSFVTDVSNFIAFKQNLLTPLQRVGLLGLFLILVGLLLFRILRRPSRPTLQRTQPRRDPR